MIKSLLIILMILKLFLDFLIWEKCLSSTRLKIDSGFPRMNEWKLEHDEKAFSTLNI